jgi:predicted exporter
MNLLVLTKVSKFALIGSLSAYLSFASKFNPSIRQAFIYIMIGIIAAFLIAVIWEGRDYILSNESTEESLSTLMTGLNNQSSNKRQYFLSTKARLEIVIAFVVIIIFALIGAI